MKKKFYRNSDLPEFSLPEFRITGIQFTGIHRYSRIPVCPIKFTVLKVVIVLVKNNFTTYYPGFEVVCFLSNFEELLQQLRLHEKKIKHLKYKINLLILKASI